MLMLVAPILALILADVNVALDINSPPMAVMLRTSSAVHHAGSNGTKLKARASQCRKLSLYFNFMISPQLSDDYM